VRKQAEITKTASVIAVKTEKITHDLLEKKKKKNTQQKRHSTVTTQAPIRGTITPECYILFPYGGSTEQTPFRNLMTLLLSCFAAEIIDSPNKSSILDKSARPPGVFSLHLWPVQRLVFYKIATLNCGCYRQPRQGRFVQPCVNKTILPKSFHRNSGRQTSLLVKRRIEMWMLLIRFSFYAVFSEEGNF